MTEMEPQTAAEQMKLINDEAMRLHERDVRARRIADTALHEAFKGWARVSDSTHHAAHTAVMLALAMVYDQDGELKLARAERDRFKKLAEDTMAMTSRPVFLPDAPSAADPGIPMYRFPDGTPGVLGEG